MAESGIVEKIRIPGKAPRTAVALAVSEEKEIIIICLSGASQLATRLSPTDSLNLASSLDRLAREARTPKSI